MGRPWVLLRWVTFLWVPISPVPSSGEPPRLARIAVGCFGKRREIGTHQQGPAQGSSIFFPSTHSGIGFGFSPRVGRGGLTPPKATISSPTRLRASCGDSAAPRARAEEALMVLGYGCEPLKPCDTSEFGCERGIGTVCQKGRAKPVTSLGVSTPK